MNKWHIAIFLFDFLSLIIKGMVTAQMQSTIWKRVQYFGVKIVTSSSCKILLPLPTGPGSNQMWLTYTNLWFDVSLQEIIIIDCVLAWV